MKANRSYFDGTSSRIHMDFTVIFQDILSHLNEFKFYAIQVTNKYKAQQSNKQ